MAWFCHALWHSKSSDFPQVHKKKSLKYFHPLKVWVDGFHFFCCWYISICIFCRVQWKQDSSEVCGMEALKNCALCWFMANWKKYMDFVRLFLLGSFSLYRNQTKFWSFITNVAWLFCIIEHFCSKSAKID